MVFCISAIIFNDSVFRVVEFSGHVPYAGLEKRTATFPTALTSAGDGCHYQPTSLNDKETLAEKLVEGSKVVSSAKMSVENNDSFENLNQNAKSDCSVCRGKGHSKDENYTNPQLQKNGEDRGTNDKTLYSKSVMQSCVNAEKPNSKFLNSQVCDKEIYYAEPLFRVNKNQNETNIQQDLRALSGQTDAGSNRNANEKLRNVVDNDVHDAGGRCFHKETYNKSSQNYEQNSYQNLKQNTNVQTCRKFVCDSLTQSSGVNISKFVLDNTDFNNNDMSCENRNNLKENVNCHIGNNTLEVQTKQSVNHLFNKNQGKILSERNSSNSVDINASEIEMYGKQQQYTTSNIDRVLQTDPLQPFVRLERISVASKGHNTVEIAPNVCGTAPDTSHKNCDNTYIVLETLPKNSRNTNTSHLSEVGKTGAPSSEFPKEKAKRVLLGYTRAVSKSTCTTPSLCQIAAEQQQSSPGVENSLNTVNNKILPSKKSQLQQTNREVTETKKVQPAESKTEISSNINTKIENVNSNTKSKSQLNHQIINDCTPVKANPVFKDETNTFVKPSAAAPRRKFRMTPQHGSEKFPKTAHSNTKSQALNSDQSDVESEFDFKLLKIAKQTRQKQFSSQSDCDNFSQLSTDSLTKPIGDDNTKCLSKSLHDRCAVWSVVPVTPKKRPCVPARPAFSDCGSRRPVFDSPMSVKSVGKLRKRGLDDSGIYSPGNTLAISPGGTSLSGKCILY